MSTYIPLGKNPKSAEERKELIGKRIELEDYLSHLELPQVQRRIVEFLMADKGYGQADMEVNKEFHVALPELSFPVKADIVLKIGDMRFLALKCVMSSMESWERHSLAFCRVADTSQIPYAVVTDGEGARLIDVIKGGVISEGLDAIPSRQDAVRMAQEYASCPYAKERCEREKRILHAFEAIKCSTNPGDENL